MAGGRKAGIVLGVLVAALGAAPAALAGPGLHVGAAEDAAKWGDPAAKMALARNAGFDSVRMTAQWSTGMTAPAAGELDSLQHAAAAATAAGIDPVVAIYNVGSSSTPADATSRAQFASFAKAVVSGLPQVRTFVVGNEPNSNLYWLPQYDADGVDAAAAAYEQLLAATYDAIKSVRNATVVGGALDPRGTDNPTGARPTHSPTSFIRDLGAAYRASGRTAPLMDVFDEHVYADSSSLPPSMGHPNTTTIAEADYGKLVALLGEAFDGTAQRGSTLPILYGEFGVESAIPAAKAGSYTGTEPAGTQAVDEATQARYYAESFKLALCQPNVIGIMVFHVSDESARAGWQSGPYYADDTPKSSLPAIRDAAAAARAGTLTSCPDTTVPTASLSSPASGTVVGPAGVAVSGAGADDVGIARVELAANGVVVGTKFLAPYTFTWRPTTSGPETLELRVYDAAGNVGRATVDVVADVTAPETAITGRSDTTFAFTASEPATFACSLDGGAFADCTSPFGYGPLGAGDHSFQVRAADAAGNVDATPATLAFAVSAPAPAPSGGGGGGGGGGGLPPDLGVTLSADPAVLAPGNELLYRVSVTLSPALGSATGVRLDLQLPAGVEYARSYANRGPGCAPAGAFLHCDLDWLSLPYVGQVLVWTTVRRAEQLTATVHVFADQQDVNPGDNDATLTLAPPAPPAPAPAPSIPQPAPRLAGKPVVGSRLRVVGGTRPYRWRLCRRGSCRTLSGAGGTSLKVRAAWLGRSLVVATRGVTLRSAPVHR